MNRIWCSLVIILILGLSCSAVFQTAPTAMPIATTGIQIAEASLSAISLTPLTAIATPSPLPATTTPSKATTSTLASTAKFQLDVFYPLAVTYKTDRWTVGRDQTDDFLGLIHNRIANCFLRELGGTDVWAYFIGNARLGRAEFEIWGWKSTSKEYYQRLYFASQNFPVPAADYPPAFQVRVPYDAAVKCASEAEKVIATLHTQTP